MASDIPKGILRGVGKLIALVSGIRDRLHTPTAPTKWQRFSKGFIEWGTLIGIWAAACVAIWAICAATHDARDQRQVMTDTLKEMQAEQRAWVSVQQAHLTEPLRYDTNGIRITLQFDVKNTGKNPGAATYIALDANINVSPNPTWQREVCAQKPLDLGVPVFPGDMIGMGRVVYVEKSKFVQGKDFRPTNVNSIRPAIAACVSYKDGVTGKWHHTPYSYVVQMNPPRPGRGCCNIIVADGDMPEKELIIQQWPLNQLGPD